MSTNSTKRSNSLIRTVILFSSVLAIVGVLFAVVQYMGGAGAGKPPTTKTPIPPPRPIQAHRGDSEPALTIREELPKVIGGKGKSSIRIYSPDSTVARMEILVRDWKPTGRRKDEFQVVEPEIRFRTPNGQEVRVVADRGLVDMKKAEGGYDPRRGRLEGNVVFEMDRLSARERKALAPELRDAKPTPDRLVHAELKEIEFDLEASRIETEGRFRVEAVEGSMEGIGLAVRYDELNSRIERLEITQGLQIVLRRAGQTLRIALPGSSAVKTREAESPVAAVEPEIRRSTPLPEPGAEAKPAIGDDGLPILLPDEPKKTEARPVETYRATFEGGVAIEETDAAGAISRLESETLRFLFDFGRTQRAAADGTTPRGSGDTGAEARAASAEAQSQVVLTWSGRFSVDFVKAGGADATGDRVHVVAAGEPVHLRNRLGSAVCNELEYHNESQQVWLRSDTGGDDVTVSSAGTGRIVGREVFFDRAQGRLKVLGPGVLSGKRSLQNLLGGPASPPAEASDERGMHVRFGQELMATFDRLLRESADEMTGQTVALEQEYLRSARFVGDVLMSQDQDSIAAEEVAMKFVPWDGQGPGAVQIERLTASGNVRLRHGKEWITCGAINVDMDVDERGKFSPRHARAEGSVVAVRGARRISAAEAMLVDLRMYEKAKPPFDPAKAWAKAAARGIDPHTVDWDRQRVKYEQEKAYDPGLRRLQALGDVIVRDPKQGLNVSAASLDCTFVADPGINNEQRIDKARVTGDSSGSPASVEFGDFSIQGFLIDLDAGRHFAQVPGAGWLSFNSRTDLDASDLDTPIPISVTWTQRMTFRGQANHAVVVGAVHAASEGTMLDCPRLAIGFEDVEPVAQGEPENKWWIFTPLMDRRDSQRDAAGLARPRLAKRAVFLSASGGAVALTSNQDEATGLLVSRAHLSAEQIDLDLKRKLASIDCAGKLLIEDYRPRKSKSPDQPDRTNPFGVLGGDEPSQTYLEWTGSMAHNFRYHTANFDKDVMLIHRTGSKLVLADRIVPRETFDKTAGKQQRKGRDARLTCKSLFIQFKRDPRDDTRGRKGLSSLSGFALDKFQAENNVYFVDSGVSVTANRITYDQEQTLLGIFGAPALVYDEREGFPKSYHRGPAIYWNRSKNLIEAQKSTIFAR